VLPRAWRDGDHAPKHMLTETIDPQLRTWTAEAVDPAEDRMMLAIQYTVAIVAALAAGLLSLVN
jgi:hypothetical protein